ncbi:phage baseplate assembly protein V [Jatrophihabitans sp.]|uniref:phage baseplate assembly protein V n=1 Tax=Jatrophihabitans sp. TaxID=1932789 RepID=UPI002B9B29B2|nr:phage baseplate assembly protein V [Jatrophihabitans sp.]
MALPQPNDGAGPTFFGVYPAWVTDLVDPKKLGRIEVSFPFLGKDGNDAVRAWATLCTPYADKDQGLCILPEVGSQVLVAFEAGNFYRPYIIGSAWNGKAALPHAAESSNDIRLLRSRADSRLEFDDTKGAPKVTISTASGHQVVLDDGGQEITVRHATGCTVKLTATNVEIQANVSMKVTAPMVQVTAPMSTFSGVVQCDTVIASAFVISPAYTPGVGNIW